MGSLDISGRFGETEASVFIKNLGQFPDMFVATKNRYYDGKSGHF